MRLNDSTDRANFSCSRLPRSGDQVIVSEPAIVWSSRRSQLVIQSPCHSITAAPLGASNSGLGCASNQQGYTRDSVEPRHKEEISPTSVVLNHMNSTSPLIAVTTNGSFHPETRLAKNRGTSEASALVCSKTRHCQW